MTSDRLIRVSVDLIDTFGGRTLDGCRLSYGWGEPTELVRPDDRHDATEPVYTPTIITTDDGMAVVKRADAEAAGVEIVRLPSITLGAHR